MTQNYTWPSVSVTATNPSVSTNGNPAPGSSTLVAGINPSNNQQPLHTDASNNLLVAASDLPLPTGAATAANQSTDIVHLATIDTSTASINSNTIHVDTGNVTIVSSTLPTGAATSANQTTEIGHLATIDTNIASINTNTIHVDTGNVTISTALPAGSANIGSITNITGTVSLPTGASTSALQTSGNASLTSIDSKLTTQTNGLAVVELTPVAGTITQAAITVGTTAVRLTVSGSAPSTTRVVLSAIADKAATGLFYIGSSSVTSSGATAGIQLTAGQPFVANDDAGDYWIISDTAGQTVYVMEQA